MNISEFVLFGSVGLVTLGWLVAIAASGVWFIVRDRITKTDGEAS